MADKSSIEKVPVSHCHQGMVFAVNCGPTGSANSFDNFKASAIAQGAADSSSAVAVSTAAPPSPSNAAPPSSVTIPPAPLISTVTAAVTLDGSTWTTTYGSYPNSPAPTPASLTGNIIKVVVGGNSTLTFTPSVVQAYVSLFMQSLGSHIFVTVSPATPLSLSSRPRTTQPRSRRLRTHASDWTIRRVVRLDSILVCEYGN